MIPIALLSETSICLFPLMLSSHRLNKPMLLGLGYWAWPSAGRGGWNYNVGGQRTVWRRYGRMKGNWVPNLEIWLHLLGWVGGDLILKKVKNGMKCARDETCFHFLIQLLLYPNKVNDRLTTSREHPPPSSPHSLPNPPTLTPHTHFPLPVS